MRNTHEKPEHMHEGIERMPTHALENQSSVVFELSDIIATGEPDNLYTEAI